MNRQSPTRFDIDALSYINIRLDLMLLDSRTLHILRKLELVQYKLEKLQRELQTSRRDRTAGEP
ncbi:MAG: hypothetical protein DWQ37_20125 [Planctomycetota bacterium]|nr:MAG: hypothetical protein DWQ37_20125 [Planctomycetota bacterium]